MIKIRNKSGNEFFALKIGNGKNTPYILYPNMYELNNINGDFEEIEFDSIANSSKRFDLMFGVSIQNIKMMIERYLTFNIVNIKEYADVILGSDNYKIKNMFLSITKHSYIMMGLASDSDINMAHVLNSGDTVRDDVDAFFNKIENMEGLAMPMFDNYENAFILCFDIIKYSMIFDGALDYIKEKMSSKTLGEYFCNK